MSKETGVQFFEGAEKLLEVWFTRNLHHKDGDLRKIPRQKFQKLLKLVQCEVISFTRNDNIDAYVLSESSMFVTRRCLILKTCGTTTPLQCIPVLLLWVRQYSGFDQVEKVFYSHKSFKKPDFQAKLHRDFQQEVQFLDSCFEAEGITYCQSSDLDEKDSWYLYILYPVLLRMDSSEQVALCGAPLKGGDEIVKEKLVEPDQTIEISMSDLNPKIMELFSKKVCTTAEEATKKSGIDKLIPMMHIDDFLFDPCGYSMNGILPSGAYMTIHVTPEVQCSYVSFETNVAFSSYTDLIKDVLKTFQPGNFVINIFANKESLAKNTPMELKGLLKIDEWNQITSDVCKLNDYNLSVGFYSKFPS